MQVPRYLHEAFGEHQSWPAVAAVIGFGIAGTLLLVAADPSAFAAIAWWRAGLAIVLMFDVLAGAVANFTRGTNDYYAARPSARWVFIGVHIHLPLIALLLGTPLWPVLLAWGYTIAAATVVNLMADREGQVLVGGLALGMGLLLSAPLSFESTAVAATAAMFVLKVVFAFAVDHYRAR